MGRCAAIIICLLGSPLLAQPEGRFDPDVKPAQFVTGPSLSGAVADPPTPQVRLQIRTPATIAPGQEVPYRFIVTNTSAAEAYKVTVRCPIPVTVAEVTKVEPKPTQTLQKAGLPKGEYVWVIGTMKAGSKEEIELTLKPTAEAKEVVTAAHITFEFGQTVTTKIDRPKLKVDKQAPEKVAQGERFPVRVIVANTGKVAIKGIELVEDVSPSFQYVDGGSEGERTTKPTQRIWKLGAINPGQQKVVEYFLKTDDTKELLAQSVVRAAELAIQEQATSTTKIQSYGFSLELTGLPTVQAGDSAKYEIKVTNTGTLPLKDLKVTASLPKDCTLSSMTDGGRRFRDSVEWVIPDRADGPLKPGQAYTLRFGLKADSSGVRTVRAVAEGPREMQQARELKTNFEGSAVLRWRPTANPVQVNVGREGTMTVKVENAGSELARNVRLQVELPPEVQAVQVTPRHRQNINDISFDAIDLRGNSSETYTITYKAVRAGSATFKLKLFAEGYEKEPLRKEQEIRINP